MLRYKVLVTVYRKDEESNNRDVDFPYDERTAKKIEDEISFQLDGQFMIDDENLYELRVSNIEQNN
jgi:hypothetical protein